MTINMTITWPPSFDSLGRLACSCPYWLLSCPGTVSKFYLLLLGDGSGNANDDDDDDDDDDENDDGPEHEYQIMVMLRGGQDDGDTTEEPRRGRCVFSFAYVQHP